MSVPALERKTIEMRCALTTEELRERGDDLAQLHSTLAALREEKRVSAAEYRDQIKAREKDIERAAREIRERAIQREVLCELRPDYRAGVLETYRLDTGELHTSRPLLPHERQGRLFNLEHDEHWTPDAVAAGAEEALADPPSRRARSRRRATDESE